MTEYRVKVYEDRTCWYNLKGQRHRENGPACEWNDGSKVWYLNGLRHRINGPAVENNVSGHKEWFVNDQLHRLDGPAIEYASGTKKWFINGDELTEEEFNGMITLKRINSCANKVVEIDGKKYKLIEI